MRYSVGAITQNAGVVGNGLVKTVSYYFSYGNAFIIVMIGSSILKNCAPVNREAMMSVSHVARNAAMYTQGIDRICIESANQIKFPIKNNAQGVIAVEATTGLIIVRVAINNAPLPIHFRISQCACVIMSS